MKFFILDNEYKKTTPKLYVLEEKHEVIEGIGAPLDFSCTISWANYLTLLRLFP